MSVGDDARTERLAGVGQSHLVEHARSLPEEDARRFLTEAAAQPWEQVHDALENPPPAPSPALRPPRALTARRQAAEAGLRRRLAGMGEGLLREGRVATMLLAGGQGSRLGFDGPKGCFAFGPGEEDTLYALLAARVAAATEGLEGAPPVPLLVLVSESTREATEAAFETHGEAWGLQPGQARIVQQGSLPVVDASGRGLLEAPGRLARAPDGHGGALEALVESGQLAALREAGVEVLTTFQVDNPLARPLDGVMLGWMLERRAQVVTKVVARKEGERVGLLARDLRGRHLIVEYSEAPEAGLEELKLGSIAIHAFSLAWLARELAGGSALPLHVAHKRVAHLDDPDPDHPNARKLERFLFDVFPRAERVEGHEVLREREFAPVKNAEGEDSPATARALVEAEVRRFHEAHGGEAPADLALRPRAMARILRGG